MNWGTLRSHQWSTFTRTIWYSNKFRSTPTTASIPRALKSYPSVLFRTRGSLTLVSKWNRKVGTHILKITSNLFATPIWTLSENRWPQQGWITIRVSSNYRQTFPGDSAKTLSLKLTRKIWLLFNRVLKCILMHFWRAPISFRGAHLLLIQHRSLQTLETEWKAA